MQFPHGRRQRKSLKECTRNFTWGWYTVVMGTGSLTSLASRFHFGGNTLGLRIFALVLFLLNLVLFIIISSMTVARFMSYPELFLKSLRHPIQGYYIGAFSIAVSNIIDGAVFVNRAFHFGGKGFLYTLWGFWWANLGIALVTTFAMLYIMYERIRLQVIPNSSHIRSSTPHHSLDVVLCLWVFPVITLVVVSAAGGSVALSLISHSECHALATTAVSFSALIIGLSLTLLMLTDYFLRLLIHGVPKGSLVLSSFLILSPLGEGGFSFLINGENLSVLMSREPQKWEALPFPRLFGQIIFVSCLALAWTLWSFALAWTTISSGSLYIATIGRKSRIPFSLSYWSVIFPNGVFALCSVQLGRVLNSTFFDYFGVVWTGGSPRFPEVILNRSLSVIVLILWVSIAARTIPAIWDTSIFAAPEALPSRSGDCEVL
ncbi:hypothetical protein BDN72DRAFT_892400 [Pluteus cervinus]|uniref:Uncharacterized protein n=1 Tax=Pluteus cervinus TaxID=181527 RepID=A0ACD3BAV3_9AGAR|nr:hypothetical protein BDN72DRAFT_892400 [Pluteus cervinus]